MEIIRKTIINDEPYLRKISENVDLSNDDYKEDVKVLEKFCKENKCILMN